MLGLAALTLAMLIFLAGILWQHRVNRVHELVPCPACNGMGVLPVGTADPQLDDEIECGACQGEQVQNADAIGLSAADALANRVIAHLEANGYRVVMSEYRGLPPAQRWEAGAFHDLENRFGWHTYGELIAGPITGETYLTAIARLARELDLDLRRIPS